MSTTAPPAPAWQDDAELDRRLLAWLQARSPAGVAARRFGPWHRSDGGFSNVTLLGEMSVEGAAPTPLVLRLQSDAASVFPATDLGRQYRVMAALRGSAVPVPPLLGLETDPAWLGSPFYLMRRVAGAVPNENPQYHVAGWFHAQPAEAQRACWLAGIDLLAEIARVDWRARGLDFLAPPAGRSALEAQLDEWARMLQWAEALGRPYPHLRRGLRWLRQHQPAPGPLALSWGDAKLGNCVFDGTRIAAALDWEQATLADPVDDLAWWLMVDDSLSRGYDTPRLPALPTRAETIAHWEQRSGRRADRLAYHEVFAAWRMACIMARIGTVFTARGWVPAAAQMDLHNGGARLLAGHAARLGFADTEDPES